MGMILGRDLALLEQAVGHNYKFRYEITDSYSLPKYKYEALLEELSSYEQFNPSVISEVMVVEVKLIAEAKTKTTSVNRTLYLTKEGKEWRVLYLQ